MNDFTTTVTLACTPAEAYAAVLDVRAWWTDDIDGPTDALGAEFTFRGKDVHRSLIRITALVPGERVEWLVLDNYMTFVTDQSEWRDTRITFELSPGEDGTQLRFSHLGLVPAYECFDTCSNAWGFFINDSLRELVATGAGKPILKDTATT